MWRKPATPITPGQFAGVLTAWPALLPAEATMTVPCAFTCATASMYAWLHAPVPPRLMLMTRALLTFVGTPDTASPADQSMPAMMSES